MPTINPSTLQTIELIYNIPNVGIGTYDGVQSIVDNLNQQASGVTLASSLSSLAGTALTFSPVGTLGASTVTLSIQMNKALNEGVTVGDVLSIAAAASSWIGAALVIGAPLTPIGLAFTTVGLALTITQAIYNDAERRKIDPTTNTAAVDALNWVPPRRDPLVLDLDGSGITTSAINPASPILFDHDGDGTKTASGWIASGEAIVVRDLNGNGTIDSGRELFGDNTLLTSGARAGQTAAHGFEALADLDSNADGQFNNLDAAFASVKLWKDANQNGISETGELFTFAQLGVASINVAATADNVNLGGGNTQTQTGSFTKTDGNAGDAGTAHLAGSPLLANNNFYREFTDDPVWTSEALALPQMQGSGLVRDLRPAMSLGTAQAAALQTQLTQFATDTTRDAQLSHLDALIQNWGATSAMHTSAQTNRTIANYGGPALFDSYGATAIERYALDNPAMYAKITALEQFNGEGATKNIAFCARSTCADDQCDYVTTAPPQSSGQTPCSPSLRQYESRCAKSGSSRRVLRHQCKYDVARTQMTSPLATSPKLRAWCEWQDRDVFLEQRVYPRLRLQRVTL